MSQRPRSPEDGVGIDVDAESGSPSSASGAPSGSRSGVYDAVESPGPVSLDPAQLTLLTQLARSRSGDAAAQLGQALLGSLGPQDAELYSLVEALAERARAFDHQRRLAGRDELTGVANRRSFNEALRRETARARRTGRGLSLLMLDLDGLKHINDSHGHAAGDIAIQAVANACLASIRDTDQVARLGGDEFALLLPGAQGEEAATVGERVRRRLSEHPVVAGRPLEVSLGHARLGLGQEDEGLLERADRALYRNKHARQAGR